MGCALVLVALFAPRLLLAFIWLLTDWLATAYETNVLPFVGFLFLPYTTLAYMSARLHNGDLWSFWGILYGLAILVDLGIVSMRFGFKD